VWQAQHELWGRAHIRKAKQYSEHKALTVSTPHSYATDEDFDLPGIDCELRFAGQWEDAESGLHFNFNRYYDPQSGQYLSQDPIGLEGGLRTQGYVADPLTWVDPLGLAGCGTQPNVTQLPKLQGKSVPQIQKILRQHGYQRTNPGNLKNERWVHPDGSEVQIHKYGNVNSSGHKSGNNAHVHKDVGRHGTGNEVPHNDRGFPDSNKDNTHIGIRNPIDYPVISGRPHGDVS
jgi:RHS repeat-associated protein